MVSFLARAGAPAEAVAQPAGEVLLEVQVDGEAVGAVGPGGGDVVDAGDQDQVDRGVGPGQHPRLPYHDGLALTGRRLVQRFIRLHHRVLRGGIRRGIREGVGGVVAAALAAAVAAAWTRVGAAAGAAVLAGAGAVAGGRVGGRGRVAGQGDAALGQADGDDVVQGVDLAGAEVAGVGDGVFDAVGVDAGAGAGRGPGRDRPLDDQSLGGAAGEPADPGPVG